MKKALLFLCILNANNIIIPTNYRANTNSESLFKNIFNSWKRVILLEWNEVSFFDICNIGISTLGLILAKKLFIEGLGISSSQKTVQTEQNNQQPSNAYIPTIAEFPTNQPNSSNENRTATPINQNFVSNDQGDYLRISQRCSQIREYFSGIGASRSSGAHNAVYQYLISENSLAARRIMEELIRSKQLNDYRSSYGIK